jgi:chromosome segregation ATPase
MRYAGVVAETVETEDVTGTCALEGCSNPLPEPARDERGRLKGGKPSRYCGKAHADEASRRRRALEAVSAEEPLLMLRALGGQTREVVDSALGALTEIRRRWDELDAGAVAQSVTDRAATAAALARVERAERAVADAERVRAQAVQAAAEDQKRRVVAEEAAQAAVAEAEATRKAAWEKTAEHERARGQAETRATLAEQGHREVLDRLEETRRELRDVTSLHQDTARRLAEALSAVERAETAAGMAQAQAAGAEERARMAVDAARTADETSRRVQEEAAVARAETAAARSGEERARDAEAQARADVAASATALAEVRTEHAVLTHRVTAQEELIRDLRAQVAAAADRERALIAAATAPPASVTAD